MLCEQQVNSRSLIGEMGTHELISSCVLLLWLGTTIPLLLTLHHTLYWQLRLHPYARSLVTLFSNSAELSVSRVTDEIIFFRLYGWNIGSSLKIVLHEWFNFPLPSWLCHCFLGLYLASVILKTLISIPINSTNQIA